MGCGAARQGDKTDRGRRGYVNILTFEKIMMTLLYIIICNVTYVYLFHVYRQTNYATKLHDVFLAQLCQMENCSVSNKAAMERMHLLSRDYIAFVRSRTWLNL